jgi:hypothetical protein
VVRRLGSSSTDDSIRALRQGGGFDSSRVGALSSRLKTSSQIKGQPWAGSGAHPRLGSPTEAPFRSCIETAEKIAAPGSHHSEGAPKAARSKATLNIGKDGSGSGAMGVQPPCSPSAMPSSSGGIPRRSGAEG